ncbi:MAG: glycosyltransferase, partial [Salibacteraceae bacterium]
VIAIENLSACKPSEYFPYPKQVGVLKMVFVSRISPKKNLLFLLELLEYFQNEKITLDIYGPKEDAEYWKKCQSKMDNLKGVAYRGVLQHDELQSTLKSYHLFVLPTLNENFGHIILEALNSSLPILLSDNTPWLKLEEKEIGYSISLSQKKEWVNTLQAITGMNEKEYSILRQKAWSFGQEKLKQEDLLKEYIQLFS